MYDRSSSILDEATCLKQIFQFDFADTALGWGVLDRLVVRYPLPAGKKDQGWISIPVETIRS